MKQSGTDTLFCLLLAACGGGGGAAHGPSPAPTPVSAEAPGWARAGDAVMDDGHRFICEGQAASEDDAMAAANAICDDKICKLCGVEVESVVQTKETLTGVELQRQVIERCRRVRKADTAPQRKLVDCGPGGCTAWVQIFYGQADQDAECKRFSDENFADPAACQNTIEAFKNVPGYSAASFRERIRLIDDAIGQCAEIDVRPTPLMQSLGEKIDVGMKVFRKGAPGYLANYWLADYPPMWQAYKESDSFVERLQMLRKYLAHKVLIMDVIEASLLDHDQQDTAQAMARLLEVMGKVTRDEAYATQSVHMFAIDRLAQMDREGHLTVDTAKINAFIRETYPPDNVVEWNHFMDVIHLFRFDRRVDQAEWDYALATPNWTRAVSELLELDDHGGKGVATKRFLAALERALAEAKKPTDRFRQFKAVAPWTSRGDFILDIEARLPADIRAGYTWDFLADVFSRTDDEMSKADFDRFLQRMAQALAVPVADAKEEERACGSLAKNIQKLEEHEARTDGLDARICQCLESLAGNPRSYVNKSDLYDRALDRNLSCVRPNS